MPLRHRRAQRIASRRAAARPHRSDVLLIRQLREENLFLRKQFHFLQGKCERLELSLLESKAGAPAAYVDRTEESKRPPIGEVESQPGKLRFATIREQWNKLSVEDQEKHLEAGDWKVEPEAKKKKKETRH